MWLIGKKNWLKHATDNSGFVKKKHIIILRSKILKKKNLATTTALDGILNRLTLKYLVLLA